MFWVALVGVCLLPAANVGSVISSSFSNPLPSSDESVRAANLYAAQFPNSQQAPSSAIVLLEGPNIVGPAGKNATQAVTASIASDHQLRNVSSVVSLYVAYTGYLTGQAELGWSFLGPALYSTPALPTTVNATAYAWWGPVGSYVQHWQALVANQSAGTPPANADWPAYNATRAQYVSGSFAAQVLATFYGAGSAATSGFNVSVHGGCLTASNVSACATTAARTTLEPTVPSWVTGAANQSLAGSVLALLGEGNWSVTAAQRPVVASVLAAEVGIAPSWLLTLWQAFPTGSAPTPGTIAAWAAQEVARNPTSGFPLPIPASLSSSFVNRANTATLVLIAFNVDDSYQVNGSIVTYDDVSHIQHDVTSALGASPAYAGVSSYVTGGAPFDDATTYLATSALSLLLVLTIIVLLVIMLVYFRAPAAPALSFGLIGVALVQSLAVMYVLGRFITSFNPEVEPVVLVFLMSIGTDYSVFLLARYREEIVRGTDPGKAVEQTVRWAGQSITTSGLAVMVVTVALSFSGINFLEQMGNVLFFTVLLALLVNLTLLPAILVLVGPRIFWPNSGARFQRYAERRRAAIRDQRDYIARAGYTATRRPVAVIALIGLLSLPVLYVAFTVPVSYDITNIGLPSNNPAEVGFRHLSTDFGSSYTSSSYALVSFTGPVVTGGTVDRTAFQDIAGLAATIGSTAGVASVDSVVGGNGVPLSSWLNFSSLPPAERVALNSSLGNYLSADGRTVVVNFATNASGYSAPAIGVLDTLRGRVDAFTSGRPEITQVIFGGAAPVTQDIKTLVDTANERMLTGAAIGLFLMMLLILGSAFVPILALGAIGLAIVWGWASTYFVVGVVEGEALIFLLPLILLILVLGLGMDYSVLLLTRVREERAKGQSPVEAIRQAVTHAGSVITAAAVILGGAFLLLGLTSPLGLLAGIGLGIGIAVLLQAFVVQTYLTPAILTLGKDGIWKGWRRAPLHRSEGAAPESEPPAAPPSG